MKLLLCTDMLPSFRMLLIVFSSIKCIYLSKHYVILNVSISYEGKSWNGVRWKLTKSDLPLWAVANLANSANDWASKIVPQWVPHTNFRKNRGTVRAQKPNIVQNKGPHCMRVQGIAVFYNRCSPRWNLRNIKFIWLY